MIKRLVLFFLLFSIAFVGETYADTYCTTSATWKKVCTVATDAKDASSVIFWRDNYTYWSSWVQVTSDNWVSSYSWDNDFTLTNENGSVFVIDSASSGSAWSLWWSSTKWWDAPTVNCYWLPGCPDTDIENPGEANLSYNIWLRVIANIIGQAMQFVAVIAVIALILSGMMYLLSGWEEEKTKKAKTWIIWSLVWVFLSVSAWGIINLLNKITIW